MSRAQGIDVSHWKVVRDWDALVDSGVSFVGFKATEGNTYVDPTLRTHRENFRKHPFALGIYYHFARSGSARTQAERLQDVVGALRPNERLCLDLEVSPTPDPRDAIEWVDEFFATLMQGVCSDRRPIIYTSHRIWKMIGAPAWDLAPEIDLWAPRYNLSEEPRLPGPWATAGWTFWQWTDGGGTGPTYNTPGVGRCDANYFRGDVRALREYAGLVGVPVV